MSQAFATFRRANLEDRKPTTTTLLLASAALGAGCANWRPFGAEEMRGGMVTDWYLEPEMLARLCIALVFGLGVSLANAATLSISGGSSATELTNQAPGIPQGTTGYSSTAPTGGSPVSLRLDAFSALKFEYLGSQALNNNTNAPGSRLFSNSTLTLNGTEQGTQYFNLQLPYAVEGSTSNPALRSGQIVLLGLSDGGGGAGDSDFKDMTIPIRVAPVPDTWMMMVAGLVIMGFVVTRRARKN